MGLLVVGAASASTSVEPSVSIAEASRLQSELMDENVTGPNEETVFAENHKAHIFLVIAGLVLTVCGLARKMETRAFNRLFPDVDEAVARNKMARARELEAANRVRWWKSGE